MSELVFDIIGTLIVVTVVAAFVLLWIAQGVARREARPQGLGTYIFTIRDEQANDERSE